ncbi:hypothetical protein C5Y96_07540 [Blastopirellula marina]|uniref:Carboxypeptidase regulatory-like domain-containing protein n=1 Tax=Blastopirellula marina TaxID=124 RepID=A0A2S8FXX2_9BACT|nr:MULTISPECIES: carboxypeptidase-like regulatory domain-containing protein [Pirellulaceae]PQO37003.1 hypothetical protein C5Y96_07540 [Blastopirellula marina]RCS53718.1 carboxypeptidase regulatory-like domain-containing protein [Bremerella cremea]
MSFPTGHARSWQWVWLMLGVLAWGGCSSNGLPSDAASVEGTVTMQGAKVVDAVVVFRSDSGDAAVGKTNEEGKFQLSSASIPGGTRPGHYQVTIVKREPLTETASTEEDPNYNPNQRSAPSKPRGHLLPEKYSRPNTSELKADIVAGKNTIDFELTP